MKLTDILEKDRERILSELTAEKTTEKAAAIVKREFETMLYKHNQESESPAARAAAAHMLGAAAISSSFTDTVGSVKVYEYEAGGGGGLPKRALMLLAAGIICLAASIVFAVSENGGLRLSDHAMTYVLFAAGAAGVYFAGRFGVKRTAAGKKEKHTEIHPDPQAIYKTMRTMSLAMDQSLEETEADEAGEAKRRAAQAGHGMMTGAEIDLFAEMLEACYSGDGDYALEKLKGIPYFLHRKGIDVVDYNGDRALFDVLPGQSVSTIRPALLSDGRVLKKGLASGR